MHKSVDAVTENKANHKTAEIENLSIKVWKYSQMKKV